MPAAFRSEIDAFCARLRRRQLDGSLACARGAADVLRALVAGGRHASGRALLDDVRRWGVVMQAAKPLELSIGNVVRRVLHMIREECVDCDPDGGAGLGDGDAGAPAGGAGFGEGSGGPGGLLSRALRPGGRTVSLHNLLDSSAASGGGGEPGTPMSPLSDTPSGALSPSEDAEPPPAAAGKRAGGKAAPPWAGRPGVIEQLNELIDELDEMDATIAMRACDHIHANEIVLTLGHCATTLLFLKEAAKKRPFQVVVAEAAPSYDGHSMAAALAAAGVATTLVADAAVFAVMARVHKVVLGARCVLASGGVMAAAGGANVAAAAQRHAVPVVALVGTHQLSPLFPHDPALAFNDFGSPADVLPYEAVAEASVAATAAAEAGAPPPSPRAVEAAAAAAVAAAAARPLLHAHSPRLDYIPPAHVALFVTDTGGYTPAYVYRLLAEYYSRDDYSLTR